METLEELVGEFIALEERQQLEKFGGALPQSPGLPVPDDVKEELRQRLQSLLHGFKAYHSNQLQKRPDFLATYSGLADILQYTTALQWQFPCQDDGMFQYYLSIPQKLLAATKPKGMQQVKIFADELHASFAAHCREISRDVPVTIIREKRKVLAALLDEYDALQRIGSMLGAAVRIPKAEKYVRAYRRVEYIHQKNFLPLVAAYCGDQWESRDDLLLLRRQVDALVPGFIPQGISAFFSFSFPDYAEEAQQFAQELLLHHARHTEVAKFREQLSSGTILSTTCPAELRRLRYLAPALAQAAQRESEAVRPQPQRILPETPSQFPSIPQPSELVHPQLRTAYAYLLYPIGWVDRLARLSDSLAEVPAEKRTRADLQYCVDLRSYLTTLGVVPLFSKFRSQFPALERNYRESMAQLEQLAVV